MNSRLKNFIFGFVFALIPYIIAMVGYRYTTDEQFINRVFIAMGGIFPFGMIQFITYIAFVCGLFEIVAKLKIIKYESHYLKRKLLPEQENYILSPENILDMKFEMIKLEKNETSYLIKIIKKACIKFNINKSTSEMIEVIKSQIKVNNQYAESGQSFIRYLIWVIPSIGFIGTVIGIGGALGIAHKAADPNSIKEVTNTLGVSFDTTLVALLLSVILMWFFHELQEKEEILHNEIEEYVIENLVNRIDTK